MSGPEHRRVVRLVGLAAVVAGLSCIPPLAGRIWALEPLHAGDHLPLWLFAAACAAVGIWLAADRGGYGRAPVSAITVVLLGVLGAELAVRTWVRAEGGAVHAELVRYARRTYEDTMAYQGHPFLHFTGRPRIALEGNDALGDLLPFNELGFLGPAPAPAKPEHTLRVGCLGGSTTARGYPAVMRGVMQQRLDAPWRVEELNLAHGGYCSAHCVAVFVLIALDYDLDYVVFHQGWNDRNLRDRGLVRGDYGYGYRSFAYPTIPDALLIRGSVIYRWLRDRLLDQPEWAFLEPAIVRPRTFQPKEPYTDLSELAPYRRNIRTIADLALVRGIVPVLVTQPRSTDPRAGEAYSAPHMDQCNDVLREVAASYGDRVVFVDLAAQLSGRNELFVDLGHMNEDGIWRKANAIGGAILAHWSARTSAVRPR